MPRTFSRDDGLVPVDLVHCGVDHLTAALLLFKSEPGHYDAAGYLAHLGVELLLKGWLLEVAGSFEATHDLGVLYEELADHHGAPALSKDAAVTLEKLDSYGDLRYPNLDSPIEVGNDDRAGINAIAGEICSSMPQSIQEALGKIEPFTKAGRVLMKKPMGGA